MIHGTPVDVNIAALNPGTRAESQRQYLAAIELAIDRGAHEGPDRALLGGPLTAQRCPPGERETKMSGVPATTSSASAAYIAVLANAIKACGTVVRLEPSEFQRILSLQEKPLIVRTVGGLFSKSYKYLTSYRGLAFHCKSPTELRVPEGSELINAKKMSIPDL